MILTITGPSASGKTSLARAVSAGHPHTEMLGSVTTRIPRPSDLPGEYQYVSEEKFLEKETAGAFLWSLSVHGNRYGTLKETVDHAAQNPELQIAIITVEATKKLREYLASTGHAERLLSVYLDIADEQELLRRLTKRGDKPEDIEIRIRECRTWAAERDASGVPFLILDALTASDTLGTEVLKTLSQM